MQCESTLHRLVFQESLPPLVNVGTAEGKTEFGGGGRDLLIYELKTKHFAAYIQHKADIDPDIEIETSNLKMSHFALG